MYFHFFEDNILQIKFLIFSKILFETYLFLKFFKKPEHFSGNFPLWLAPEQVRVLPITENQNEYAVNILDQLKTAGIRTGMDISGNKIGAKIRDAEMNKVHTMLVVGKREQENSGVAVRLHGSGDQGIKVFTEALADLRDAIGKRSL